MRVDLYFSNWDQWLIGMGTAEGADEYGEFNMFSIGIGIVGIDFIIYKPENNVNRQV